MKIQFLICAALSLAVQLPNAAAFQTPAEAPLPNQDQRKPAAASALTAKVQQERAAAASLQSRVAGLRLNRDRLTGTPRWLSASRGFLTGAGGSGKGLSKAAIGALPANDPHRIVKAFVNEHAALFGHDAAALEAATLTADAVTAHNGLRTVIWQQTLDGVPVYGARFISHLTKNQELVSISDLFVPDLPQAGAAVAARNELVVTPPVSGPEAVRRAAANLGEDFNAIAIGGSDEPSQGAEKKQRFNSARLRGPAYAQLVWLPLTTSQLELCWQVILSARVRPEMYLVLVNARTGEVHLRQCLTVHASDATYNVFTSDSPTPFSPGLDSPRSYQPPETNRVLVTLTALSTTASPNGWINDGVTETRGNNVDAHLDRDDNNSADVPRPQGSTNRVFNFTLDLTKSPLTYGDAAVVNLFYWNNFMHDKLYELGFTEPFGNYQNDNFGRGGVGGDAVQADAQDGADLLDGFHEDNANFAVAPDGVPGRMQMYLFTGPNPDRDGDLDTEVMCHEYTHGLSYRLLGGGAGITELQTWGMAEGWSDFYPLCLLSDPADNPHATYAVGGYASYKIGGSDFEQNYYYGIRRYPYSTDLNKNPLTLKDIDPTQADPHAGVPISPVFGGGYAAEVHNQGEVWCMALWEVRANLIDKLGTALGNQTMLQLVTDGLKLAPANATFLEARDAILLADEVLTGGDNANELWLAFAKRGMGLSASVPTADTTVGVVEAFDVPSVGPSDGIMEVKVTPPTAATLFGGATSVIQVRVTDGSQLVTNATIAAKLSTGGTLNFRNDGVAPDTAADNSVYTANFLVPNTTNSISLTLVISAPDKDTGTNRVDYVIVPVPPNDNFTNAVKVPANGAVYATNNKRATTEPDEPAHAGVTTADASLWWSFTPTNSGPVLIDTADSGINTVIAVYTGNALSNLQAVVSADDVGSRRQAYVILNAQSGVPYRIAAASQNAADTGTLRLAITPNGIPDTNAPSLTVSSPLSGDFYMTNRIVLTGTAIDPDPNPSGLREIQFRVNAGAAANDAGGGGSGGTTASLFSTNWSQPLGIFPGLNVIEVSVRDVAGNLSPTVTLEATYLQLEPPNDIFKYAIDLSGTQGTNSGNSTEATKEVGEPNHANNEGGKSVWWRFSPPADGVLTLTTTNSTFDTLLGLYTGTNVHSLTTVANNDDAYGSAPGGFSSLTAAVRSNQVYYIAVDGYDGAFGVVFLRYNFKADPLFRLTIKTTPEGTTVPPTSLEVRSNDTVVVTATGQPGFVFDAWDGDIISFTNPLPVLVNTNLGIQARFVPAGYTEDFESGALVNLPWTNAGNATWSVQTNVVAGGRFAARSGVIGHNQSSSLILTANFLSGNGSFAFRVGAEPNYDTLGFYVNGILQQQWSGETGWSSFGFPLTAGTNTLEWRYTKDAAISSGLDAAFLDNINLPLSGARLFMRKPLSDGSYFVDVFGTPGQSFVIQAASSLDSPILWESISTNVTTTNFIHVIDPVSQSNQMRFYQVVPLP